jgi:hypothetical protein
VTVNVSDDSDNAPKVIDPRSEAIELGAYFCANPDCALHVRIGDPGVAGEGNWMVLPDGRTYGRLRRGAEVLCDACVTGRGPVKMPIDEELRDSLLAERSNQNE